MLIINTRKGSPWSMAWEHPATAEDLWNKDCKRNIFGFKTSATNFVLFSLFEWIFFGMLGYWDILFLGGMRNAKNIRGEVVRSDKRKESKNVSGKISFHSQCSTFMVTYTTEGLINKQASIQWHCLKVFPPVNRPIFLWTQTHPGSIATSPGRRSTDKENKNLSTTCVQKMNRSRR